MGKKTPRKNKGGIMIFHEELRRKNKRVSCIERIRVPMSRNVKLVY
jgi:hypothetical protein